VSAPGKTGVPADETVIASGEKALPPVLSILEGQLAKNKWLLGSEFSLVDCAYCPILNDDGSHGHQPAGNCAS
jgi:glutathione S-transferase